MVWKKITNETDYPKNNLFIVYIGKSGRIGCGFTDTKGSMVVGSGGSGIYYFKDIYMYSYIDLPPYKELEPLYDKRYFTNTYLYTYLHMKGLV